MPLLWLLLLSLTTTILVCLREISDVKHLIGWLTFYQKIQKLPSHLWLIFCIKQYTDFRFILLFTIYSSINSQHCRPYYLNCIFYHKPLFIFSYQLRVKYDFFCCFVLIFQNVFQNLWQFDCEFSPSYKLWL